MVVAEHRGQARAEPLRTAIEAANKDFRLSAHVERLQLMDLLAVKECTDKECSVTPFPPARFRKLSLAQVNERIEELKGTLGE